ncbi:hypothetical protein BgiBS90_003458 [Biomphalaria glabrata]|nr:hypothetical protein BgiBS90_003458 [Biomphalaria glabrata]
MNFLASNAKKLSPVLDPPHIKCAPGELSWSKRSFRLGQESGEYVKDYSDHCEAWQFLNGKMEKRGANYLSAARCWLLK